MRYYRFAKSGLGALALLSALFATANSPAAAIRLKIENLAPQGGLWFTPVFLGFHDGSFDLFDPNDPSALATPALEAIAETGDPSGLVSHLSGISGAVSHVLTRDPAAAGPPGVLFSPGSSNSLTVDLDPTLNRYLSFASMIIPSNDAFFGNANPTAYDLFNIEGRFNDGFQINLYGADLWDAGTELNDGMGAAFSALGGMSTSTMDPIFQHSGLDLFVGTTIGTGEQLAYAFDSQTPVARITAERVPDSTPYIGALGLLALFGFRAVAGRRMGRR